VVVFDVVVDDSCGDVANFSQDHSFKLRVRRGRERILCYEEIAFGLYGIDGQDVI